MNNYDEPLLLVDDKNCGANSADNFRDLLKGNIDIIEYLNSESASLGGASSDATLEEDGRLHLNHDRMDTTSNGGLNIHVQSHLLPLLHPGGVHHNHNNINNNARPLASSHVAAFRSTQARLPSYEHVTNLMRLPDSPPETDSGAGSAGSPSGSEASPYSPEFQFHHPGQMQGSVIHPPVVVQSIGGGNSGGVVSHSQQPGVILNVHGLDNLTQAIVNDYILPVQTNARVTNGHNQMNSAQNMSTAAAAAAAEFYPANQTVSAGGVPSQNSPNGGTVSTAYSPYILPPPVHNSFQNDNNMSRKRPRTENSQFVKPEPTSPPIVVHGGSDDSMYFEENMSHQSIRFFEFQKDQWNMLCDLNGRELKPLGFHVVADKGFNYSHFDGAFVNQKKNHFQVSVHIEVSDRAAPKFVKINGEGGVLRPISEFQLDFYGVKAEMLNSTVLIKQSQTDRKPITYEPVKLDLPPSKLTKVTVARLHFSETTMNNQRKNGRSNPDQKYFYLVAALNAVVQNNERYTVVAYSSEKVIVRASNPGQFDNGDNEVHWQKGQNNSIYHPGPVGVGTDKPTSALAVAGDIHCTGTVFHPSDAKLKQNISEVSYSDALSKLSQIRIVRYEIKPDIAEQWGLSEEERNRIGVIAQEVEEVIPDAVRDDGEYLTVDDNRIFYESAAAVKELCRLTGNLEFKIDEVEKISKKLSKLSKLKRLDSVKSNASSNFSLSSIGAVSPSKRKDQNNKKDTNNNNNGGGREYVDNYDDRLKSRHHHHYHHYHHVCRRFSPDQGLCSNKVIQSTIIILVIVMAFCLVAMATLYFLDWHKRNSIDYPALVSSMAADKAAKDSGGGQLIAGGITPRSSIELQGPGQMSVKVSSTAIPEPGKIPPPGNIPPIFYPCPKRHCEKYCCSDSTYSIYYGVNNEKTKNKNKTDEVIVIQTSMGRRSNRRRRHVDIDLKNLREGDSKNLYHVITEPPNATVVQEKAQQQITTPVIQVLGSNLNFTLDDRYCMDYGCADVKRGNYTLYVPVSSFLPLIPLEVKFNVESTQQVEFCGTVTGELCYGIQPKNMDGLGSVDAVQKRQSNSWELPIGLYFHSSYKFRIGYSTALCSAPNVDAGASFLEYTIWFYRLCG